MHCCGVGAMVNMWAAFAGPVGRPGPAAIRAGDSDEDIARRLQQQYDAEMAAYMRANPGAPPVQSPLQTLLRICLFPELLLILHYLLGAALAGRHFPITHST